MSEAMAAKPASDALALTYERVFAAPRETVFRAWTDPSVMSRWWGPKDFSITEIELDARASGNWMTVMRSPAGSEHRVSGVYHEIVPPKRIVFTWAWENDGKRGHETVVTVDFEDRGGRTLMRFHQARFANEEQARMHNQGWTSTWEGFDTYLATGRRN